MFEEIVSLPIEYRGLTGLDDVQEINEPLGMYLDGVSIGPRVVATIYYTTELGTGDNNALEK